MLQKVREWEISSIIVCLLLFYSNLSAEISSSELSFSHNHGFYTENFTLILSSENEGAQIYYTLDGSNPFTGQNPIILTSPSSIEINPNNFTNRDVAPGVVVRACAVLNDTLISDIVTQTYLFSNKILELSRDNVLPGPNWITSASGHDISYGLDPEIYNSSFYSSQMDDAFLSIPTISMVTDLGNLFNSDSGIYVNALYHGKNWERAASIELLNPDGSEGFQINCGVRIRGGWSRHYDNPKHAFRFIFRDEYGEGKLKYPLFGDEGVEEFDNIDLRTSQNYSWSFYGDVRNTFLREVFSRDTQRDMGQPYTRSRFYHLFINGTYWGLFQTQERSEASFAESYFGGNEEDYDVIKVEVGDNFNVYEIEATDGTLDKWRDIWTTGQTGFADDNNYFKIQGLNIDGTKNPNYEKLIDVENLIDYMIVTFYVGDFDGPISAFINNNKPNNFYAIYNRVNPDGFKFFRHDGEHSMFDNDWGTDRTGPFSAGLNFMESNPQWFHQKLSENDNYRLKFRDRVYKHFFNNGCFTKNKIIERLLTRKSEIETAIIAESARWGDSKSETPLNKTHWESEINNILYNFIPSRQDIVLDQLKNKGLYSTQMPPQFNQHGGIVSKGFNIEINSSAGEVYYTTDGTDPFIPNVSESGNFSKIILEPSAGKRVLIPKSSQNSAWKTDINFDDSGWLFTSGSSGGVGYDDKGNYDSFISLFTKSYMHESGIDPNTSCYLRIPFSALKDDLDEANKLFLDLMYDDGFVLYLNGTEILDENAPDSPGWNSISETYLDSPGYVRFDISQYLSSLKEGENLLAIHGLNTSLQSSDFLILPKLTLAKETISGSISSSAKLYTAPIEVNETVTVKTRSNINGEWSTLNEAKFIIDEDLSDLKITELHYHPLDEIAGADTVSGSEFEFLELKNIGENNLILSGASFTNGITFEFGQGTGLASGEFLIIASNAVKFNERYGFLPDGEYEGQLNNGGERVVFNDAVGDTVFNFRYNDKLPWPEEADGDGFSLVSERRTPIGNPDNVNYWTLSGVVHGSPGENDVVSDVNTNIESVPNKFSISANYPNPFNPVTNIAYSIPRKAKVNISVFDILGRNVEILVNEVKLVGNYNVKFDGSKLSSGIYFYKITANDFVSTKKMVLLK